METPTSPLTPGARLHGFTITRVTPLPELAVTAVEATHEKSGARLLHLLTADLENLFAIAFRTPPEDDTGLPHILEHTVLCGSQRYPVKDPFVELLKRSLATFLNAMTYPDKTVYPCASLNKKDYFNLASVYCDAVFHPLITEAHFKQEGHHLEFAEPGNLESPLLIKGIVYNEMRGAYSDLDGIIEKHLDASLFPENAYGRDSGGDPEAIPSLTYAQFTAFHKRYYHPSNALIFIHGDIPTADHLAFLDREVLSAYDRLAIETTIASQPRWNEPRRATHPYPAGPDEEGTGKTAVTLNFFTTEVTDPIETLAMHTLDYYLLGNAASPLRKALIDSKLGEELTDAGYADHQRDTFFTVGLKGTEPVRAEAIAALVFTTLKDIAAQGLEQTKVESALHLLELQSREIGSMYPLGLMDRVYRSWLYEADPLHLLQLGAHLTELKRRLASEPRFLEGLLERWLLNNPHYTLLTFIPDGEYNARQEAAYAEKLARIKATLDPEALARIDREAQALAEMQATPNSPEALATLPRLALSDVSPEPMPLPTATKSVAGRPLLLPETFTNGIAYLRIAVDLTGLEEALVDLLPLYLATFRKMGAGDLDYAAMAEREAAVCGGLGGGAHASGHNEDPRRLTPNLIFSLKALESKLPEALGVLEDRLLRGDLNDRERMKDIVLQTRVHLQSEIIPSGNRIAALQASRGLCHAADWNARLGGAHQTRLFRELGTTFAGRAAELVEKLLCIRAFLLARARLTLCFGGSPEAEAVLTGWGERVLGALPEGTCGRVAAWQPHARGPIGLATPADVAFDALAFPTVGVAHPDAPALTVLAQQLSYDYLWNAIRVQGGAYGARAGYNAMNGLFTYSTYRDPRINESLAAFAGAAEYIATGMDLSDAAVEQAIIGSIKALDAPIRPEQAVSTALGRYLHGTTDASRQAFRTRLLALTGADLRRAAAEHLAGKTANAPICVLSSREKLTAANKSREVPLAIEDL